MSAAIDLVLPGDWWRVPLDSEQAVAASTRALAASLYKGDALAKVRAEIRGLVTQAAHEARKAGAQAFYFALEIVPGVPVPLSLATYTPTLPPRLSAAASALASAESLAGWLEANRPEATVSTWVQGEIGVARELRLDPPADDQGSPTLRVDYWLAQGESDTVVLSFSAPLLWEETAEPLLELMDAVASTVEWSGAPTRQPEDQEALLPSVP